MLPLPPGGNSPPSGEVKAYLGYAEGGEAASPVPLPVNLALGRGGWAALLSALDAAGKYVAMDLTDSAMSGTVGEFDPGEANTGEKYVVSLVLPSAATSIKAGIIDSGNVEPTFKNFTALTNISGIGVMAVSADAFSGCTSLAAVNLPAAPPIVGCYMFSGIDIAQTITIKVLAASISAYNTTWQTAFKGVGGNASALNTGSDAGTENTNITLILQAQYDDVSANVTLWANENGSILGSPQDMRISKTASSNPDSFTVTVAGAYTLVQWQVNGIPLGSRGNPLTIAAADYAAGKTYILGVQVTKDGVPYSTDIRFTVEA